MTLVSAIDDDDQEATRKHIVFKLQQWAFNLDKAHLDFDSAEELVQFFIGDMLTNFYYAFSRDKKLAARILENMLDTMLAIENHNKEQ